MQKLLVIIPIVNEADNLRVLIPELLTNPDLKEAKILVIDDASIDGSKELVLDFLREFGDHRIGYLRRSQRLGIGIAHLDGLNYAALNSFTFAATMDGDLTHGVDELVLLFNSIRSDPHRDIVTGSRFLKGDSKNSLPLTRKVLNSIGHIITFLFFSDSSDMSSGLRIYRTSKIPLNLFAHFSMGGFDFFFKSHVIMKYTGLNIAQIPVSLHSRKFGRSKLDIKLFIRAILELFYFRLSFRRKIKSVI